MLTKLYCLDQDTITVTMCQVTNIKGAHYCLMKKEFNNSAEFKLLFNYMISVTPSNGPGLCWHIFNRSNNHFNCKGGLKGHTAVKKRFGVKDLQTAQFQ